VKFANTASSIDSGYSRIKTDGLLVYLPSSAKWNSSEHAVALHGTHYNFCRIHQMLGVISSNRNRSDRHIWDLEEIIALPEPSAV